MERNIRLLSVLLAIQLVVVGIVWYRTEFRGEAAVEKLLVVETDAVTAIEIAENADTTVRVEKGETGWRLPGYDGLPADAEKVRGLLSKLAEAEAAWPVATSEASAARFEVTEQKFQRRVRAYEGDTLAAEIFLGTSPGFRKVHARRAGSNDVYAITFANYEAPAKAEDWLDKALLRPPAELTTLARKDGWRLDRQGDDWVLDGLAADESTEEDAARDVVSKVNDLRVLGRADSPPAEGTAPVFELELGMASGDRVLRFYRPDAAADFVVATDAVPGYFRVAAYIGEALDVDRAALIAKPATPAEGAQETPETEPSDTSS